MGGTFKNRRGKPPIARLEHSHRRLEQELENLGARVESISRGQALEESWSAISEVVDYLHRSVVRHEEDEEQSVFPRLASHPTLRPLLQRLRDDHASQQKLVARLAQLVEQQELATTPARLERTSQRLVAAYLDHIAREDRQLLPAISRHCSAAEQAQMGEEMGARRESDGR